jgi:hypothetical protein
MASADHIVAVERETALKAVRISPFWQVLILLAGVFVLAHDLNYGSEVLNGFPGWGDPGVSIEPRSSGGFWRVIAVTPGGPGERAGIRKGDEVGFVRPVDVGRTERVGETVGVNVRRNGATWRGSIIFGPRPVDAGDRAFAADIAVRLAVNASIWPLAIFVVLRSRRRASTCLFGATLVCLSVTRTSQSALAESDPRLFPLFDSLVYLVWIMATPLFLAFALAVRREIRGKASPILRRILIGFVATAVAIAGYLAWFDLTLEGVGFAPVLFFFGQFIFPALGFILALFVLGLAWRESRGQERTRLAFMLIAGVILFASRTVLFGIAGLYSDHITDHLISSIGALTGAGVLAYALMRHRVVDLGFVVNRTLVYGVVSVVLLAAFGLIEWAVEHFLPISGREQNAIVDAAIAVAVFLAFHRVRDFVEHVIERLFFRRWQTAEAELRRFVREAAFVTRGPALEASFAEALTGYGEGAAAAVYLAKGGGYARTVGEVPGVPAQLDADLPVLINLRADPRPIEVHEGALIGRLIAPMVNRNEVLGLAVLGPKPSGLTWRPDEVELIGWATRLVGLDLHALQIGQLEGLAADLNMTNAMLRNEIATLRSVIPQRS